MDINEMVKLAYQLMLMSNRARNIEVVNALDKEVREYLHDIGNVIFSDKKLSIEAFDMYDLMKYRYMEDYQVECDYILKLIV